MHRLFTWNNYSQDDESIKERYIHISMAAERLVIIIIFVPKSWDSFDYKAMNSYDYNKSTLPVSYTHLDVYKRQGLRSKNPTWQPWWLLLAIFPWPSSISVVAYIPTMMCNHNYEQRLAALYTWVKFRQAHIDFCNSKIILRWNCSLSSCLNDT